MALIVPTASPLRKTGWPPRLICCLLLLVYGCGYVHVAQAQAPSWQSALGSSAYVSAVAVNAAGDVFVTGGFTGTTTFGAAVLTSAGQDDMFLAKWSASTNGWAWAVRGGGTDYYDVGNGVAVSGSNVYVTGTFGPGGSVNISGTPLTGAGVTEMFVAKYIDQGASVTAGGALSGGGVNEESGLSVAVSGNNVYVAGKFFGASATIGGSTLLGAGGNDLFVAKYVDTGVSLTNGGAVRGGGTADDQANGIAVNGTNVYITGFFTFTATLSGTTLSSTGGYDVFIAKYVDTGTGLANGGAMSGGGTNFDEGNSIAVNGANVYITGYFGPGAPISFSGTNLSNTGGSDVFIAKYVDTATGLTNGGAMSDGGPGLDLGRGIVVNGTNVYVAGDFAGTTSLGGTTLTSVGSTDVFLARYVDNSTGLTPGGAVRGGSTGLDIGIGIATGGSRLVVGGRSNAAATFGSTSLAGDPSFLAFAALSPVASASTSAVRTADEVAVFPNPAQNLAWVKLPLALTQTAATATLLDGLGRSVRTYFLPAGQSTHSLPLTGIASGVYQLRINAVQGVVSKLVCVD